MGIFEALMLIAFGSAWPVSIVKSYRARSNKGKSLVFLVIVLIGYFCGIVHKILNDLNWVVACYILNACLVSTDIAVWFRNRKLEKTAVETA